MNWWEFVQYNLKDFYNIELLEFNLDRDSKHKYQKVPFIWNTFSPLLVLSLLSFFLLFIVNIFYH